MLFCNLLYKLYAIKSGIIRNIVLRLMLKFCDGELRSTELRRIFREYHNVEVGNFTTGGSIIDSKVAPGTIIGRYSSIAGTAIILNRNHPMDFKSTHAFFFNPALKLCDKYIVKDSPLKVGNDVRIGEYAVILAHVTEIGDGAVIKDGAIVNKNVPPYAIVAGNPSRVVRYRFQKEVIGKLLASRWWEKDFDELKPHIDEFQKPYEVN